MSDTKKFWRESVGVLPRSNKASAPGVRKSPARKAATLETPRHRTTQDPPASDSSMPEAAPTGPAVGAPSVGDPALPARARLAPVESALGSLPVGSIDFPEQVAILLWPGATAADLQRLAEIAGNRHLTPVGPIRDAVLGAVLVRQTFEKLIRARARATIDSALAAAQSGQWTRLPTMARETRETLEAAEPGPASAVVAAAEFLLPEIDDINAESRLALDLSELRSALSETSTPVPLSLPWGEPLSDVQALLNNLRTAELRQGDPIAVEAYLAGGIARQWLQDPTDRADAELARRILERVQDRLQAWIDAKMSAHSRDFEWSARMSAWRRLLMETRSQVDEVMTRPAAAATPGPTQGENQKPSEEPGDSDEAMVEHLRQARNETQSTPAPRSLPRWLRWFTMASVTLTAVISGSSLFLPPLPKQPLEVSIRQFADITRLSDSRTAGEMLIATADPQWEGLDAEQQQLSAARLASKAGTLGLRAGLLIAHDGTPLAAWSPGAEPHLRPIPALGASPETVAALLVSP